MITEPTLTAERIQGLKKEVETWLKQNKPQTYQSAQDHQLTGSVEDILVLQILIPLLVSVTGSLLKDFLKGQVLQSFGRKKVEEKIQELVGKSVINNVTLREENEKVLKKLLRQKGIPESRLSGLMDFVNHPIY